MTGNIVLNNSGARNFGIIEIVLFLSLFSFLMLLLYSVISANKHHKKLERHTNVIKHLVLKKSLNK
jgi:hypothetical protein